MDFFGTLIRFKIIPFLKKGNLFSILIRLADIIALTVSFQVAYLIYYSQGGLFFLSNKILIYLYLLIIPIWLLILYIIQAHEIPRTKRYRVLFSEYLQSAIIIVLILLLFFFLARSEILSRRFLIGFAVLGFIFLFSLRMAEYKLLKTYRSKGYNYVNLVLIADDSSVKFIERLRTYPEWGYRIMLLLSNSGKINEKYRGLYKILPEKSEETLQNLMEVDTVDEVIYIKNQVVPGEVRKLIRLCEGYGIVFRLLTNDRQPRLTNAFVSVVAYEKFLTFTNVPHKPFALSVKKFMDINISVFLLILLSPLMLSISLVIFLTSSGPVIYKQPRIGLRGRQFDLYKFRTMVHNADELKEELRSLNEMDGPTFKIKDDPRITRVGRILRRTGLDELPQLINVFKGEMSLIGPRPPLREETKNYKPWQLRRLSVKPGLSCFWQVKPDRNSIKFEKWMELDLAYIDNWSPRLDFIILLKTIRTVFTRTGA